MFRTEKKQIYNRDFPYYRKFSVKKAKINCKIARKTEACRWEERAAEVKSRNHLF